eukprot:3845537-Pleurochrysis_carterae.AAC.1
MAVWNWRRRELLVSAPALKAIPLGIHQVAVAPAPPQASLGAPKPELMLVTVGTSAQPKFWRLLPPIRPRAAAAADRRPWAAAAAAAAAGRVSWELRAKLGTIGGSTTQQPKSLSSIAFGDSIWPSPSGAPHGLTLIGGGGGRIFLFDAPVRTTLTRFKSTPNPHARPQLKTPKSRTRTSTTHHNSNPNPLKTP